MLIEIPFSYNISKTRVSRANGHQIFAMRSTMKILKWHLQKLQLFDIGSKFAPKLSEGISNESLLMIEKVKTAIGYYFVLPFLESPGHPTHGPPACN